jgi:hypothetical protein
MMFGKFCDIMTLGYVQCDDMFVKMRRRGYVRQIVTYIYYRHIATLLCFLDCNVTMFVTLRRYNERFYMLHCNVGFERHIALVGFVRQIEMLAYVGQIVTS